MDNMNENEVFSFGGNEFQEDFSYSDISESEDNSEENTFPTEEDTLEEPKYEVSQNQQFDPFAFVPSNNIDNNTNVFSVEPSDEDSNISDDGVNAEENSEIPEAVEMPVENVDSTPVEETTE